MSRSSLPYTKRVSSSPLMWSSLWLLLVNACVVMTLVASAEGSETTPAVEYGADVSFPMQHEKVSVNYPWLPHNVDPEHNPTPPEYQDMVLQPLGDRQSLFDAYLEGCIKHYDQGSAKRGNRCVANEKDRLEMSLRQPQSMKNYTTMGFTKIRAPEHVFSLIKDFWNANKHREKRESWPSGNVYVNHWDNATGMVSVEDTGLEGGGYVLKQHIWNAARQTIEEWTGQQLAECSLYGIRVYKEGSILSPHVDRLPLVSSAIINVDQDVDEPWPLEVIGHDGKAHNVTMVPGDLVLYESHSVIHGRPFPLKGRFMANVFVHFEPVGELGGQVVVDGDLPPYIIPGSEEEENWRLRNPNGHKLASSVGFDTGSTKAHHFAFAGDEEQLVKTLDSNAELVNVRDKNGWTPLHEAVRSGHLNLVRLLLDRGADVNARTGKYEEGGSPLWWAHREHGDDEDHAELMELLEERDGKLLGPEL